MFTKTAAFYDAIYAFKDYEAESEQVHALIRQHKRSSGNRLLDVGCGTGKHIEFLPEFECDGLDINADLLAIARERHPDMGFHEADMADFSTGKQYDVVTCLFSAVGYLPDNASLDSAMKCFADHLVPGGVAIVEPWLDPSVYKPGYLFAIFADEPDLKIARMNVGKLDGRVSVIDFHYMIGTHEGIETFVEPHRLTLFERDEYVEAMRSAGLQADYLDGGPTGRGILVGTKPS